MAPGYGRGPSRSRPVNSVGMLVPGRLTVREAEAGATRHGSGTSVISASGHQSEIMRQRWLHAPRGQASGLGILVERPENEGITHSGPLQRGPHKGSGGDAAPALAARTLDGARHPASSGIPRSPVSAA